MRLLPALTLSLLFLPPLTGQAKPQRGDLETIARTVLDASYPADFDHEALFRRIDKALGDIATSPLAAVLAGRWVALAMRAESPPSVWKQITGRIETKGLHGLARHALRAALTQRLLDGGDRQASDRLSPRGEYVRHALAIGPFGDEGGLFHGVGYPPEREVAALAATWRGRFSNETWRLVERRPTSSRLDLSPDRGAERSQGCHYGLVQVKSPAQQPAWLQVYCAGSYEAWWNGKRVSSVNRFTHRQPMTLFWPVTLRPGWNSYLLKTTSSNVSTFSLRIVDAKGNALSGVENGLEVESKKHIHAIAPAKEAEVTVPAFQLAEDWIRSHRKTERNKPAVMALLANLEARQTRTDVALALARKALAAGGKDPTVRAACLETVRVARHVPSDLLRTELRRIIEQTGETEHRHLFLARVDRLFADDKREDALRALDARLGKHPNEVPTLNKKYDLLRRMRWSGDARRALERLVTLAPRHARYVLALARLEDQEGNPAQALARVDAALAESPLRRDLLVRASSLARKLGKRERHSTLVQEIHKADPKSPAAVRALSSFFEGAGDFKKAASELAPLAEKQPEDAGLAKRLGGLWWLAGKKDEALAEYRRSLASRPEQHVLRSWVLRSAGGSEFAECKRFQLDAMAAVAAYTKRPEDDAAPVTLALDQMIIRVYDDGSQMEETHVLKRINDRRGIEASEQADAAADADELLELRTILPDGSWFAPHRVDDNFSMPRLAPGVFVEERYRTYKSSAGASPIDFVRFYFRGLDRPFRFTRLVVIMPKSARFKDARFGDFVLRNFSKSHVTEHDLGDLTAWEFKRENMPKLGSEAGMPALEELAPWVTYGRAPGMAAFVRAQKYGFAHYTHPYLEVRQKAEQLVAGLTGDVAKARAIHEFCHSHTPDNSRRPGSPYPVSVLLKQEGDRFMLQLALLRAAGIRWMPAVIHPIPPEAERDNEPFLNPGAYFGLRGARVHPKNGAHFWIVQRTPRHYPFARLPAANSLNGNPTAGCPYLLLEGETGVPGRLAGQEPTELADARVRGRLTVHDDRATMDARITFPDARGFTLKEFVASMNANRRQLVGRQIASSLFRGFTLRSVKVLDLDKKSQPLTLLLRLDHPRFVRRSGQTLLLPPVLQPSMLTRRFGGRGDRNHSLDWTQWAVTDWEVVIDPGKLRFAELPKGLFVRKSIFDYGLSYGRIGNLLRVRRVSILRPGRITPGTYKAFLDHCQAIDNAESRRIRVSE
ncbi:MAG: hypothetical protein QGG14_02110 [Planctomycetota bacterium]|jgi:tetratricopeptide (TPR) repeat protein|nr:hypothetical protein [Planctomycetota bacterium]